MFSLRLKTDNRVFAGSALKSVKFMGYFFVIFILNRKLTIVKNEFCVFFCRNSNSNLPNNYGTNALLDGPMSISTVSATTTATASTIIENRGAAVNTDNDKTNNNDATNQQNRSAIYCLHGQHHIEGIHEIIYLAHLLLLL